MSKVWVIDFDKVKTIDDVKDVLIALGVHFDYNSKSIKHIPHLLILADELDDNEPTMDSFRN